MTGAQDVVSAQKPWDGSGYQPSVWRNAPLHPPQPPSRAGAGMDRKYALMVRTAWECDAPPHVGLCMAYMWGKRGPEAPTKKVLSVWCGGKAATPNRQHENLGGAQPRR